nr:beta-lactamase family protein [Saprospiraceae bacterium]
MRLLIVLVSLHALALQAQQMSSLRQEVDKLIRFETNISYEEIPGFIITILDNGQVTSLGYGTYADHAPDSLGNKRFQIGGLTKVLVSHLANLLLTEAELDQFVTTFVPSYVGTALDKITIRQLLSHTSGISKIPNNLAETQQSDGGRYAQYDREDLYLYLRDLPLTPGKYSYSHINYSLLEQVLESKTNESLAELLASEITEACQLDATQFGAPNRIEVGYGRSGRVVDPWQFASFAGSEGLTSTSLDLATYMKHCFLSEDRISSTFQKQLFKVAKVTSSKRSFVGLGWHFFEHKGHQ